MANTVYTAAKEKAEREKPERERRSASSSTRRTRRYSRHQEDAGRRVRHPDEPGEFATVPDLGGGHDRELDYHEVDVSATGAMNTAYEMESLRLQDLESLSLLTNKLSEARRLASASVEEARTVREPTTKVRSDIEQLVAEQAELERIQRDRRTATPRRASACRRTTESSASPSRGRPEKLAVRRDGR